MVLRALRFAFRALCVVFFALGVVILVFGAWMLISDDPDGGRTLVGVVAAPVGLLVAGYAIFAFRMTLP
jgi:hypothetical protein